jgi:hypothetical protein
LGGITGVIPYRRSFLSLDVLNSSAGSMAIDEAKES